MTTGRSYWLLAIGLTVLAVVTGLALSAVSLRGRVDPYARQQVVQYLTRRFNSNVELRELHIGIPQTSLLRLLVTHGRGALVTIEGEGLILRPELHPEAPPLFSIQRFSAEIKLDSLFQPKKVVNRVELVGMDIRIPPPGERPVFSTNGRPGHPTDAPGAPTKTGVLIQDVTIKDSSLTLLPKDPRKFPLRFDIHHMRLESIGAGVGMKFEALLTNAKPPGNIQTSGTFGPWAAAEPGDTPLSGVYRFDHADLGVFNGIAGTLNSAGQYDGKLSAIHATGDASIPNFRLKMVGSPVPLSLHFTVLVDGGNGNTILKPVDAKLGSTSFTTSGGIIRHEEGLPRAVSLDVTMPDGDLRDVLKLAMRGDPFMAGRLALKTKLDIPPLTSKIREKLQLNGHFEVSEGKLLHSSLQGYLDGISRHAQGQPQNREIDQVVSQMSGVFQLDNALVHFSQLSFGIPGAKLDLTGNYDLDSEAVAIAGSVKLQATLSQMVTGWKSAVLRPVDRFFERDGAGTYLRFHVGGTYRKPQFGLDLPGR